MADAESAAAMAGIPLGEDQSVIHLPSGSVVLVGGIARHPSLLPTVVCQICFESTCTYSALGCGHAFCNSCYAQFLTHKISDEGHECVFARCPEEKCSIAVSHDLLSSLGPTARLSYCPPFP